MKDKHEIGNTEEEIRKIENEYIEKYREDDFYNVLNSNNSYRDMSVEKPKYKTIRVKVLEDDYESVIKSIKELNITETLISVK